MRASPLIIAPTHSKETRLLSSAAVNLHRYFISKGVESSILLGFGARKAPFLVRLRIMERKRLAIFYYGHGTKETIIGDEFINRQMPRSHLVTKSLENPANRKVIELLRDSLFFTVACDSAEDLGSWLVDNGVRAFVGSTQPMWITQDVDWDKNGVADITDVMTLAPRRLLEGVSLDQAVEDFRGRALEMMNTYQFEVGDPDLSKMMDLNVRDYRVIGDGGWKFDG